MSSDYSHAAHEARHAVMAWLVGGFRVDELRIGVHANEEGIAEMTPLEEPGINGLLIRLAGWLSDPDLPRRALWPPPYPPPFAHDPDGVGQITRKLGLSREQYEAVCELAKEIVEQPEFREAVALVAKAVVAAPMIGFESLESLR